MKEVAPSTIEGSKVSPVINARIWRDNEYVVSASPLLSIFKAGRPSAKLDRPFCAKAALSTKDINRAGINIIIALNFISLNLILGSSFAR